MRRGNPQRLRFDPPRELTKCGMCSPASLRSYDETGNRDAAASDPGDQDATVSAPRVNIDNKIHLAGQLRIMPSSFDLKRAVSYFHLQQSTVHTRTEGADYDEPERNRWSHPLSHFDESARRMPFAKQSRATGNQDHGENRDTGQCKTP